MNVEVTIPAGVLRWLATGEHGLSSKFIVAHLFGLETRGATWSAFGPSCPLDPDDLRRCRLLTEKFAPELIGRIGEMASASPAWAALVAIWDDLCLTMDSEVPGWDAPGARGRAPITYEKMQRALDAVR